MIFVEETRRAVYHSRFLPLEFAPFPSFMSQRSTRKRDDFLTPAQVRMARVALRWSLADLAEVSGVHRNTISNFELKKYAGHPQKVALIRTALETAGVIFVDQNGDGPGVRLKKAPK